MEPDPSTSAVHPWGAAETPYEELGGADAVRRVVDDFYDRIDAESPSLRAMLPRDDTTSREKLFEFLSGWLGGPRLYEEKRGHPRLRMRHLPFDIGRPEADEWMRCMEAALADVDEPLQSYLVVRLRESADWMINRPDPGVIVPAVT